jgi:hypothetical protein
VPWAQVLLDGVTYTTGHREPVVRLVELDPAARPSIDVARDALQRTLDALEGLDARLRAGFGIVRLFEGSAWLGPAHLFSFEAKTAGRFETSYAGEDPSEGGPPPPSVP